MTTRDLKKGLHPWMIFFIVITSVIGAGIFNKGGSAMKIAGPVGALVALVIMSGVAICVSECISELVQLFPISNPIVEYVRAFIDEELGWAIGIVYWLTYSAIFAAQNMTAAHLAEYWGGSEPQTYRTVIFYFIAPVALLGINIFGVNVFGWIESIAGGLKILLVLATTFTLYGMAADTKPEFLNDGFQHNSSFVDSNFGAICYVLPIMAFGYVGIETITVTAFETATPEKDLKWPSKYTVYFAVMIYLLCMFSQCLNVSWTDAHLPTVYDKMNTIFKRAENSNDPEDPSSHVLAVIAIFKWGQKGLAGALNGGIIFSILSASNSSLYVASRTLYGMTLHVTGETTLKRFVRTFSKVDQERKVPLQALLLSFAMFFWVPFMSLKKEYKFQYAIEIIQTSASTSCLIVWTALCLAYLRLWWWQHTLKGRFPPEIEFLDRNGSNSYDATTVLGILQPIPGVIAVLGCIATFVCCSATWWHQPITFPKVAIAYAAQVIVLVIFLALKIRRWLIPSTTKDADRRSPLRKNLSSELVAIVNNLNGMKYLNKAESEGSTAGRDIELVNDVGETFRLPDHFTVDPEGHASSQRAILN